MSVGIFVKAMLLNGLGFVSALLYMFEQFFPGIAMKVILKRIPRQYGYPLGMQLLATETVLK